MEQDSYTAVVGDITLKIVPLVALNANQHTKLSEKQYSQQIISMNVDVYQTLFWQNIIVQSIICASCDAFIALFASPQTFGPGTTWNMSVMTLLQSGQLWLVCIEEIHLSSQFGLWFQPNFLAMKTYLFLKLLCSFTGACTQVLVLVMIAIVNQQVELVTGLKFVEFQVF